MRLFLAAELTPSLVATLARLQDELRPRCPSWRWTRPESIHLTLRFLGEVDAERDRLERERWRRAVAPLAAPLVRLARIGAFPDRRRPRVLWVGLDERESSGRLAALAAALEAAARAAGFPAEERAFQPHLTLARAGHAGRPGAPPDVAFEAAEVLTVASVVLFSSRLDPRGARYTALERFALREEPRAPGPAAPDPAEAK